MTAVIVKLEPSQYSRDTLTIQFSDRYDDSITVEGSANSEELALASVVLAKLATDSLEVKS